LLSFNLVSVNKYPYSINNGQPKLSHNQLKLFFGEINAPYSRIGFRATSDPSLVGMDTPTPVTILATTAAQTTGLNHFIFTR
jgi:hypothetical protein